MKATRRRTYDYLLLLESEPDDDKVGHRTLPRLGEFTVLRRSEELERIVAALESALARG